MDKSTISMAIFNSYVSLPEDGDLTTWRHWNVQVAAWYQPDQHTHTYIYITCSRRGRTVFLLDHGWVPCVFRGMHDHTCNVDANYHVSHFSRIKITYSCSIMLELLKIFFQSFPGDPYFCVLLPCLWWLNDVQSQSTFIFHGAHFPSLFMV